MGLPESHFKEKKAADEDQADLLFQMCVDEEDVEKDESDGQEARAFADVGGEQEGVKKREDGEWDTVDVDPLEQVFQTHSEG